MTEKEKAAAGYLYDNNYDEELMSEIMRASDLCFEFNQIRLTDREKQREILKQLFGKMGEDVSITLPFWCDFGYNTTVGDHFFANHNCHILDGAKVTFGNHVFVASNCVFSCAEHAIDAGQRIAGLEVALPITVGDNVWIGANCVITGGVTIGENSIIGAGSVVTHDIPANVIAVGVPCRVQRPITEADKNRYPIYKGK